MEAQQTNLSPPAAAHPAEPEQTVLVPIEKIVESKTNPRKYLDPQREKEIFESVKANGVIIPLLVRPVNGKMEIVEGARRYRSAKAAGFASVPSIVRAYTDDEAFEIQLISFTQRADIHPLDEAAAYEALRKKKYDIAHISATVGKERSYIARRLQLVNLVESGVKLMREEKLPLPHALEVARLGPEQQKQALDHFRFRTPSLKELRDDIQREILLDLNSVQFNKDDATLIPKAGPCPPCLKRTGSNEELFSDISKKGNHCLDGHCFHLKIQAFNDRRKEELKAKGIDVVEISRSYYPGSKKALGSGAYEEVPASKANAYGRFVDGNRENVLVPIVIKGKKSADGSSPATVKHLSPAKAKQRYERRLEIFEDKIEGETRNRLLKAMLMRMRWPLERKEFELIVPELFEKWGDRFRQYEIDMVVEATGIKLPGEGPGFTDKVIKLIRTLTDQQLVQLTFAVILREELVYDTTVGAPYDDRFKALLVLHQYKNVDRAKIHAEVAKEMEAKKPKPPKDEPKKAKAKLEAKAKGKKTAKKKSK